MFGAATYSQVPFATISGSYYIIDLSESFSISDVESVIGNFAGVLNDMFVVTDSSVCVSQYLVSTQESLDIADNSVCVAQYLVSTQESLDITDSETPQVNFMGLVGDVVSITDIVYGTGWIKINNNQQSYQPQMYSTNSFAELTFAEPSGKILPATVGWANVNDDQTSIWTDVFDNQNPNWVNINNTQ